MRCVQKNPALHISLAALVLFSGAVSPGIEHSHPGGGEAHDHRHDGCHKAATAGRAGATNGRGFIEACVPHIHLCIWGFEFQLPASNSSDSQPTGQQELAQAIVAQVVEIPAAQVPMQPVRAFLACTLCLQSVPSSVLVEPPDRLATPIFSAPLCDAAP